MGDLHERRRLAGMVAGWSGVFLSQWGCVHGAPEQARGSSIDKETVERKFPTAGFISGLLKSHEKLLQQVVVPHYGQQYTRRHILHFDSGTIAVPRVSGRVQTQSPVKTAKKAASEMPPPSP